MKDVVQANILAAERNSTGFENYNVGYGKATSLNDLLEMLKQIYDKEISIKYHAPRQGDIRESVSDNRKLRDKLGFVPRFTVKEGLEELARSL